MRLACLILGCFAAMGALAQDRNIYIESIEIEGTRLEHVVRQQVNLHEGQAYLERDLRRAVNRVIRLPFVVDARFSLVRGSRKGRYVLRVEVVPIKDVSYSVGTEYENYHSPFGFSETNSQDSLDFGYRRFFGNGQLLLSVSPDWTWSDGETLGETILGVGYAHYNFFNRGIFASLVFTGADDVVDDEDANVITFGRNLFTNFDMSIPLQGDTWLRLAYDQGTRDVNFSSILDWIIDQRQARLSWEWDTTNDNYLPTEGRVLAFGVEANRLDFDIIELAEERLVATTVDRDVFTGFVSFEQYLLLWSRHSFSLNSRFRYQWLDSESIDLEDEEPRFRDSDGNALRADLSFGYSYDLWGRDLTRRIGDLRLRADAGIDWLRLNETTRVVSEAFTEDGVFRFDETGHQFFLRLGLSFRHSWGVLNLSYRYRDDRDRDNAFDQAEFFEGFFEQ